MEFLYDTGIPFVGIELAFYIHGFKDLTNPELVKSDDGKPMNMEGQPQSYRWFFDCVKVGIINPYDSTVFRINSRKFPKANL